MGWQWYQLEHMQIISTSLQTYNHTSTSSLSFYGLGALPASTQQCQSTKGKYWYVENYSIYVLQNYLL